jgi:hypothetical protein
MGWRGSGGLFGSIWWRFDANEFDAVDLTRVIDPKRITDGWLTPCFFMDIHGLMSCVWVLDIYETSSIANNISEPLHCAFNFDACMAGNCSQTEEYFVNNLAQALTGGLSTLSGSTENISDQLNRIIPNAIIGGVSQPTSVRYWRIVAVHSERCAIEPYWQLCPWECAFNLVILNREFRSRQMGDVEPRKFFCGCPDGRCWECKRCSGFVLYKKGILESLWWSEEFCGRDTTFDPKTISSITLLGWKLLGIGHY